MQREEIALGKGTVPLLSASAGDKTRVEARTAVLRGKKFAALVTVLALPESLPAVDGQYRAILESVSLK